MPKSDTWPGGVAMESLSNMDGAGSCDSVISMNSGYSSDSMEHLSAEERACLMYLEETIEALEVQEDSGLSTDEPDSGLKAEKVRTKLNDISDFQSKSEGTEHHVLNHTSEPQSSPVSVASTEDPVLTSLNLMTQPKSQITESAPGSKVTETGGLCITTDGDGKLKIVPSAELCQSQSSDAAHTDLGLIPPPSDFMDKPQPPAQPEEVKDPPPPAQIPRKKPGATLNLEQLRQRASAKRTVSSTVTQETPNTPPPELPSSPPVTSVHQMNPSLEPIEPKSPPAVAPKPKKLPANIILKSHKGSGAGSDGNSGHSVPTGSDRVLLDPQRVRIEALLKLGLLKNDETDSGPTVSPKLSPTTRRSRGSSSSPLSPSFAYTPPSTPSHTHVHTPPPSSVPPQSAAAVSPSDNSTDPDILPAPAAFSDPVEPLPSHNEMSAVTDVSEVKANTQVNTPPLTPPIMTKKLTPPKISGVKSATLERSGLGLSSYMASEDSDEAGQSSSHEQSPSQLRNSRPRPASLGSRKEFSRPQEASLQAGHATSQVPDSRKSQPAHTTPHHSRDSQKLPRSQGISVLICPREGNGDNRREALKKLGLLRD